MKRNAFRLIYLVVALLCVFVCLTSCKTNPDNTSSGAEASAVDTVSKEEDVNSEDVSSEETTSEPEEVVSEPVEVQENTATASQTTTKKQTSSKTNTQKQQTTQQTQPVQQDTRPVNTWTCPDPSAHRNYPSSADCLSQSDHEHLIEKSRKIDEANAVAAQQLAQKAAAHGMTVDEYNNYMRNRCPYCERPYGDGHNGTCNGYYDNNGYPHCVNYD